MAVSTIDALYNGTSEKLTTSATGITVTGTVAATAYTGDGSALTGTGSPSIDDNGNATAMTIDSDERVLIGQTTASSNTVGASLRPDGRNFFCADGNYSAQFNRKSSDGAIANFAKDDTVVGTIGLSASNNLVVGSTSGSHAGITFGTNNVSPMNVSNFTAADGSYDLGSTSSRWKDAYLSGGVYLGGMGSANKLSDYENGTFQLTIAGVSGGARGYGRYIKIGNLVHFQYYSSSMSVLSTTPALYGLPFTAHDPTGSSYPGFIAYHNTYCATASVGYINLNTTEMYFTPLGATGGATTNTGSNRSIMVSGQYYTN